MEKGERKSKEKVAENKWVYNSCNCILPPNLLSFCKNELWLFD